MSLAVAAWAVRVHGVMRMKGWIDMWRHVLGWIVRRMMWWVVRWMIRQVNDILIWWSIGIMEAIGAIYAVFGVTRHLCTGILTE